MRVTGVTLRFNRSDERAITGAPLVIYRVESRHWSGEIRASAGGVLIQGTFPTMNTEECVLFEETLARARVLAIVIQADDAVLTDEQIGRLLVIPSYEAQS